MLVPTTMALRLASKINRNILSSLSRRSQSSPSRQHENVEEALKPPETPNVAETRHHISRANSYHFTRPASEQAVNRFSILNQDEHKTRKLQTSNSIGVLEPRCFSPKLRIMDQFPKSTLSPIQSITKLRATSRSFCSKHSKKCKLKDGNKSDCKRIKMDNCTPAKIFICKQKPYYFKDCKKKEAPYPSFSESCAEDPYNKPSECKLCPWRPHRHPTFKQPKKKFHSTSQDVGAETKTKFEHRNKTPPETPKTVYDSLNKIIAAPPATKKVPEKLRKIVPNTLPGDISQWMENLSRNPDLNKGSVELKKTKKKGGGKKPCVKFPYKPDSYQIGPKKPKKVDKCKKKKKKLIVDCPEKKCMGNQVPRMQMKGSYEEDGEGEGCEPAQKERGKQNCPTADRRQRPDKKKPCKKPYKKPVICPEKPLIQKVGYKPSKKKPKKKTSGLSLPEGAGPQFNPSFLRRPASRYEEKLL